MGNGRSEWRFRRTFNVDMNVLVITGCIGKFIDSVLIDFDLIGNSYFLANIFTHLVHTPNIAHPALLHILVCNSSD